VPRTAVQLHIPEFARSPRAIQRRFCYDESLPTAFSADLSSD